MQTSAWEHESLLCLLTNVFLCKDSSDCRIWKPDSAGSFSSRSFYQEIDSSSAAQSSCASVWMGLGPPRVESFCWMVVRGKISITDNLRRGLESMDISYVLPMQEGDGSVDHLSIHCHVISFIWRYFLKACGVSWCLPGSIAAFF